MDKIGSYGVHQSNYYNRPKTGKTGNSAASEAKGTKASEQTKTELSDAAVKLLKELKKTYGNTDFIVADYETDEEAAAYLSRGRSQYSVLITPEELEKMAADENVKNENLKVLDDAFSKLDQMKKQLGEKGQEVSRVGISIGSNGEISYFAELEKVSEKQRERIEEKRESSREESREEMKEMARKKMDELRGKGPASMPGREPLKRTTVQASSVEELLEKIGQVDWNEVPDEIIPSGHRFDYTI
ncbi:MAG: hypothetical protein J1E01_07670 [Acetatifactor sp.]|nr:hypothetical protein [Acetatifactor sp.]